MLVHGARARVVRRERELLVVLVPVQQLAEVRDAGADVVGRVERVPHAVLPDRGRHQLHQPERAFRRARVRVERGFHLHHGAHQIGADALRARVLEDQVVVGVDARRRDVPRRPHRLRLGHLEGLRLVDKGGTPVGDDERPVGVVPGVDLGLGRSGPSEDERDNDELNGRTPAEQATAEHVLIGQQFTLSALQRRAVGSRRPGGPGRPGKVGWVR